MSQRKTTPPPRPDARTYSIGELARELDVTTRTIRFYEDMGLLTPRRRVRLKLILRGKRLGFSLAESRELIELYSPGSDNNRGQLQALMDKIHEKRAQLTQQLHDIEVMQLELDEAEQRCLDTLQRITDNN